MLEPERVETALARIWAEVLGIELVGADDNFFELGGDSILSIRIVARANEEGLRLAPRDLFARKTVAGLGTYGRVVATLSAAVAGEDNARLWASGRGLTRRVGLYLDYRELGVDLLELAGSDPMVVAWSREHHDPPEQWSIDREIGAVLAEADDQA